MFILRREYKDRNHPSAQRDFGIETDFARIKIGIRIDQMRDRPIKHQLRRLKYSIYCVMRLLVISSGWPLLWKLFPPGKLAMSSLNFFWNGQKSHMSGEGESHLLSQGEGIKKWPSDKLGSSTNKI